MLVKIDNTEKTIELSRGDAVTIGLKIPLDSKTNYEFQTGDIIKLRIYEKNGYTQETKLEKDFEVSEPTEIVNIILEEEDTMFAPISNKTIEYWYDISLNEDKTIIGYTKEDGPRLFLIDPALGGED